MLPIVMLQIILASFVVAAMLLCLAFWLKRRAAERVCDPEVKPQETALAIHPKSLPSLSPGERYVIGRQGDIVVGTDDPFVSKRHATLNRLITGEYQLVDGVWEEGSVQVSRNGIYIPEVDGEWEAIDGAKLVSPGTTVRLGVNTFVELPADSQSMQL